ASDWSSDVCSSDLVLAGPDLDGDRADGAWVGLARAEDLLLRRRERDQDDVVLVLAPGVLALPRQGADDREGHLLDPDDLAEGLGLAEEIEGRRLAEQRDLGGAVEILCEDRPPVQHAPVAGL